MSALLTLLKYAGLLLSAVSSIWGTLHNATISDAHGVVRLTKAGRVALSFIVLGLVINIVASLVEDTLVDRRDRAKAAEDQRRLREIVIAGQPLRSLRLEWIFFEIDPAIAEELKGQAQWIDEMPETSEDLFKHLYGQERAQAFALLRRHKMLFPWLHSQVADQWHPGSTVLLVSLDEAASVLLVGGGLEAEPAESAEEQPRETYVKGKMAAVSAGVDFVENLQAFYRMDPWPERTRPLFRAGSLPDIGLLEGRKLAVQWEIGAADLPAMLDLANPRATPNGKMPETIRVVVLADIADLPAAPDNFTRTEVPLPIMAEAKITPTKPKTHAHSTLRLEPNGVPEAVITYEMEFLGVQSIENRNPEFERTYCRAAVWQGKRVTKP